MPGGHNGELGWGGGSAAAAAAANGLVGRGEDGFDHDIGIASRFTSAPSKAFGAWRRVSEGRGTRRQQLATCKLFDLRLKCLVNSLQAPMGPYSVQRRNPGAATFSFAAAPAPTPLPADHLLPWRRSAQRRCCLM